MILRDLATTWVRANCPRVEVQDDFLKWLDNALQRGVGCSFVVGRELTRSGHPFLVYCFCGELFAFQLTRQQAARLNPRENTLLSVRGLNEQSHGPHPEAPVRLEKVVVDNAQALDRSARVTGAVTYRTERHWFVPLAVQAVCEPPGRTNMVFYHHLLGLPQGEGEFRFSLSPLGDLRDRKGKPFIGALPLFFQVVLAGEPEKEPPQSPSRKPWELHQHGHRPPTPQPAPSKKNVLGEPFVTPSPIPVVVTADTLKPFPPMPAMPSIHAPHLTPAAPDPQRFRAVSDIRAVLVEVKEDV